MTLSSDRTYAGDRHSKVLSPEVLGSFELGLLFRPANHASYLLTLDGG